MEAQEILADRLNVQPTIFRGCTSQEISAILVLSILIWMPLSFSLTTLFGAWSMGFGIAAIGILLTVVVIATIFQKVKRGRPDGYYQQLITCFLEDNKLKKSPYIRRSGVWSVGRTTHYYRTRKSR